MNLSTLSPATVSQPPPIVPSLRQMLTAQAMALLIGLPVALLAAFIVNALLTALPRAGVSPQVVGLINGYVVYFLEAVALAIVQAFWLRRSIAHPAAWVIGSGLTGAALLPMLFPMAARLAFGVSTTTPVVGQALISSGLTGLLFGAALGGVQTLWLHSGQRRWWLASTLAWGVVWAAAFPTVYALVYLHK